MLGWNGENYWAHRLMCELAHGKPPTPEHTAAHECGKGHDGCVNPRHLKWKTQAENLADCAKHGTLARHKGGNVRRLLPEQIKAIRGARGYQTQGQLAAKFGVSEGTISDIWHGRTYNDESKIPHWKPDEDAKLRALCQAGKSFPEIAKEIGKKTSAVASYAARMGIKSGRQTVKITDRPGFSFDAPRNS
jgi:DNA-binding XRE family transcriptional regulator